MEESSGTGDERQVELSPHRRSIDCDLDNSSIDASSEHELSPLQSSSSLSSLNIILAATTVGDKDNSVDGVQQQRNTNTDTEVDNNTSKIRNIVQKSSQNRSGKKYYRHNIRQNSTNCPNRGSVKVFETYSDRDSDTSDSDHGCDDLGDDNDFRNYSRDRCKAKAHNKSNPDSASSSLIDKSLCGTSSDDKNTNSSTAQTIICESRQRDKSTILRPRMRVAKQSELVQERYDDDSDVCECIRTELKNLHFEEYANRLPDKTLDHNNNSNNKDNSCSKADHWNADICPKHRNINRVSRVERNCGHSSQTKETESKCSESSLGSNVISGIASQLKRFFTLERSLLFNYDTNRNSKPSVERKKSILKKLKHSPDNTIDEQSIEWQGQQAKSLIGGNQRQAMINLNSETGDRYSGGQYRAMDRIDHGRSVKGFKGTRSRDLRRLSGPYGYLRLGNDYHHKTPEFSFFEEMKRFILLLLIVAICGVVLWQIYLILVEESNYLGTIRYSPSVLGNFQQYAVSTDAQPCAKIGKDLLAKGGHAVDAAIGTLICMGVSLPNSLGLGGGCLMTIYDNVTKSAIVIDGRETAPDYATENMFAANPQSASRGPLSIGVPGELAAYWEAHQRFGRLPWPALFEKTIEMAEKGFPTVEHLSSALRDMSHAKYITPPLAKILTNNATGEYYYEGEVMHLPELAQTLKRIRDYGHGEFYGGPTGQLFIDDLQRQGGKMTMDNLRSYKPIIRPAYEVKLNEHLKAYTQPIPGSGVVLSVILRIMNELGYYKNMSPRTSFESASLYYHHLAEAFKFAYARRAALEEQPDDPVRMEKLMAMLASDEFIRDAVSKIDDSKTLPSSEYGGSGYFQEDHGTAHVSIMDGQGNSIGATSSVNLYFGSGLVSPRTGIIYNDVMDDFTSPNITNRFNLLPSKYNRIRPGKRPLSSMAPSIFVDSVGNPRLIIGASGGAKITTAIASVAMRHLFFDEDIKTAVDGPRIHHQYLPDAVYFEGNFPSELLSTLVERGHELKLITGRSSVVMTIACNYTTSHTKKITANSDYRKGGSVDGL